MERGQISICGVCRDPETNARVPPTIRLRGESLPPGLADTDLAYAWGLDAWGSGREPHRDDEKNCGSIVNELPAGTVAADLFVGIHCKDARIQYVVAE